MVAGSPDLIFLDIRMPEIDGWLLCEIFDKVERWKHIPVVLQSGLVGAENIRKGLALGAHSYIEKPVTLEKTRDIVDSVFGGDALAPAGLPADIETTVSLMIEATKSTFNLMLGAQTRVLTVDVVANGFSPPVFDYVGVISTIGTANIEISCGWSQEMAAAFATALMGLSPDELDDELLQATMTEILNMVLGATSRRLSTVFPVQLGLPECTVHSAIPLNRASDHAFSLELQADHHRFGMLLSVERTAMGESDSS